MNDILQHFSLARIPEALEANMVAYGAFLSTYPGATFHNDPGICWFATGVPAVNLNGVIQTNLESDALPRAIDRVLAHFQRHVLPFYWNLGPCSHRSSLEELLQARGIVYDEDEPGMAVDLLALNEDLPQASTLSILPVTDQDMLRQWTEVWGCGAPKEVVDLHFTGYSGLRLDPTSPLRFYLGILDGRPVATSSLFVGGGVASIRHVVTIHQARRQGIGAAMTLMAAREARTLGYRVGVLTASPMGAAIYQRLGFRECCTYRYHRWEPESQG